MRREPQDFKEGLIRNGVYQEERKDDSDSIITSVVIDGGREIKISEHDNDIQFTEIPGTDGVSHFPKTVTHIRHHLTEDGSVIDEKNIGLCKNGCVVHKSRVFICRWCRQPACFQHVFFAAGKRVYCRTGVCAVIGRLRQIFGGIYRITQFCFRNITGMNVKETGNGEKTPEEKLFEPMKSLDLDTLEKGNDERRFF